MSTALLSTVLELARLGAIGIGAIVLLLSFFLLFRKGALEAGKGKLINRFMTLGFVFGIAAGVLGLVPLLMSPHGRVSLRLAFSPDFETENLTAPKIRLPDGTLAKQDERFELGASGGTQVVTIAVDRMIDEVRNLRKASANLTEAFATVTEQRDVLAAKAAEVSFPEQAAVSGNMLERLNENSEDSKKLQLEFNESLSKGDFVRANEITGRLRNGVLAADAPVSDMASPVD